MGNFRFFLASSLALGIYSATAQDINEAYNLSNLTVQGTARSIGFGGALGSVGGDFSAISVNPAGLGIYRSSEFSITPSMKVNSSSSDYLGTTTGDNVSRFNFNNFGIVFTDAPKGRRYERRRWKAVSVAFGMNRVADFNHNYTYSGINKTSSASQAFESDANSDTNNVNTAGTLGYLGYQSYLLNNSSSSSGTYHTIVPFLSGIQQIKSIQESGRINEYVISLGGNYMEKLMLGASLGIPTVNYQRNESYIEQVTAGSASNPDNFQSFNYTNNLSITGGGVNLKLGAIYKITDFMRIGAAIHLPTYYWITDVSAPGITAVVNNVSNTLTTDNYLPVNSFAYSFSTPVRSILSGTFILKNLGFITADYEYVNYNTMRYRYPSGMDNNSGYSYQYEADQINTDIKNTYQSVSNVRVGAEIKLSRYFMVRGGFGYYGDPYKNSSVSGQRIDISGGLGFRGKHFFADLGYVNSMYKTTEQPYSVDFDHVVSGPPAAIPTATISQTINNIALTVGAKF